MSNKQLFKKEWLNSNVASEEVGLRSAFSITEKISGKKVKQPRICEPQGQTPQQEVNLFRRKIGKHFPFSEKYFFFVNQSKSRNNN